MKRIICGIGCFFSIIFLSAGFLFAYQISHLQNQIYDLEERNESKKQQASVSINNKNKTFILEHYENGKLQKESFQISSYGPDEVVFRQKEMGQREEGYTLQVEDDYVVVYENSEDKVFEYTDIPLETLPNDLQSEILLGKQMKTLNELYDFLENYSS